MRPVSASDFRRQKNGMTSNQKSSCRARFTPSIGAASSGTEKNDGAVMSSDTNYALTMALRAKYLKHCGDCKKWMTRACPRERKVTHGKRKGMYDGPSAGCWQCDQFESKK